MQLCHITINSYLSKLLGKNFVLNWFKELQEGMDRCTGCCDINENGVKTPYNQSTNLSYQLPRNNIPCSTRSMRDKYLKLNATHVFALSNPISVLTAISRNSVFIIIFLNSFLTDEDTRSFCGPCRSRSD